MNNLEALQAQCKLICNTCYVDDDVAQLALSSADIDADGTATANNQDIIRLAIVIVKGWVETSHSEGGVSSSIDMQTLHSNIIYWCRQADLDASEFLDDIVTFESGSELW